MNKSYMTNSTFFKASSLAQEREGIVAITDRVLTVFGIVVFSFMTKVIAAYHEQKQWAKKQWEIPNLVLTEIPQSKLVLTSSTYKTYKIER